MSAFTRTVGDLKLGISGLLSGTNVENVTQLYNALERALRTMLQKASIPEASTSQIVTLYDGIYNYNAPDTIFGGAVRDMRPIGVSRGEEDVVYRQYISDFDRTKADLPSGYALTFEYENGVPVMRVANAIATPRIVLDTMSDTTGWTANGSASGLVQDQSFYYTIPASLRFTLIGNSSGYLEKTLSSQFDLTNYQSVGVVFLALEIPSSNLNSLELRIGSDSANYYSLSVTQGFLGAWAVGDWTMTAFDLSQSTKVLNPDITKMDYVRLTFTHGATMTNVRVGNLFISLPSPNKLFYESTAVFSHGGTLSNFITDDNDTIIMNDAAYNIYEHECAKTIAIQNGGTLSTATIATINAILNGARAKNGNIIEFGLYDLYRAANPSENIREVGSYYD